jgi:hypothetical protein
MLLIPLAAALIAYQALVAFYFEYSPLKVDGTKAAIYAGGYTPSLLILYVQVLFGFLNPNEDLELQRQRRVRNQALDREMGIVHKPSWWRRVNGEVLDPNENMRDTLLRNVREINGTKRTSAITETATNGAGEATSGVEMTPVSPALTSSRITSPSLEPYTGRSDRRRQERAMELAAGVLFPEAAQNSATVAARRREELMMDGPPPPSYTDVVRGGPNPQAPGVARSISAQSEGSTNQPPQQIRSMLDV